jgi:hypothetical protein
MARLAGIGERVKGIEPSCPAWEAGVLPLNYTREGIADFRFAIANLQSGRLLPRNHVVGICELVVSVFSESGIITN